MKKTSRKSTFKKTTYSKSFVGWGYTDDTAAALVSSCSVRNRIKDFLMPSKRVAVENSDDNINPKKLKVTYTVTLEEA